MEIVSHQTNLLEISLNPWPRIKGVARGTSGQPVGGVDVMVFMMERKPQFETRSKPDGSFEIPWLPVWDKTVGSAARIVLRDRTNGLAGFVQLLGGQRELECRLAPAFNIRGTVHDESGHPLRHVGLMLNMVGASNDGLIQSQATWTADGHFEIRSLPIGLPYRLNVMAEGFSAAQFDVPEGKTNSFDVGTVILKRRKPDY